METDCRNELVLAPMVRVGTLPFRLLAAEYDADITYGEEIIDYRLLKCERRFSDMFTKRYLELLIWLRKKTIHVVLRTCPEERGRVVLQIGTSDAIRALRAAETILTPLKRNLYTPVTCKIRLLKSSQDTVELARRIEKTGVSALAVHERKVAVRPRVPAKWSEIADVVAGGFYSSNRKWRYVFEYKDIQRIKGAIGR